MSGFIARKETIKAAICAASTRVMYVKFGKRAGLPRRQLKVSPDYDVLTILQRVLKTGKPDYETIKKYNPKY